MLINTIKYLLVILIYILITERPVNGQQNDQASKDTASISESDTTNGGIDTSSIIYKHNPARAAFLSAVVPGLGQIYNGKGLFWRLPILYAGISFEVYFISYLNSQYQSWHTGYVNYTNYINNLGSKTYNYSYVNKMLGGLINPYYLSYFGNNYSIVISGLKSSNDYFKQWLDFNVILMAGIYFINIIDATVTAYFFDYNITDDLAFKISPTLLNNSITNFGTLGLKISFNLRK